MEKESTMEIIPRDYCLCYEKGITKFYFAPFYHIQGNALRNSRGVLEKRLKYAQRYNKRYKELYDRGRPPYNKLFSWPDELLEEKDISGFFREKVKKKEGAYTLVDASPGEAIKDLSLLGNSLSGNVKSKEPRRKKTAKHSRYHSHIKGIFLDLYGEPELTDMRCSCLDQSWTATKGTGVLSMVECMHNAAIEQELWERMHSPNPRKRDMNIGDREDARKGMRRGLLSMFNFSRNWGWDNGYISKDKNLQALEDDARLAHYVMGENHFGINRKLLSLEEVYSPLALSLLSEGKLSYEVIAQRTARADGEERRFRSDRRLFRRMSSFLSKYGYSPDGKYLELGKPAWRYRHGDNVVGVVFSRESPPFYVVRQGSGGPVRPWDRDSAGVDPFMLVGKRNQNRLDDKTRKWTSHRVMVPSAFRLPETGFRPDLDFFVPKETRLRLRRRIMESNPRDSESKLKYSRLYYMD